jgi:hypothetical protein
MGIEKTYLKITKHKLRKNIILFNCLILLNFLILNIFYRKISILNFHQG